MFVIVRVHYALALLCLALLCLALFDLVLFDLVLFDLVFWTGCCWICRLKEPVSTTGSFTVHVKRITALVMALIPLRALA